MSPARRLLPILVVLLGAGCARLLPSPEPPAPPPGIPWTSRMVERQDGVCGRDGGCARVQIVWPVVAGGDDTRSAAIDAEVLALLLKPWPDGPSAASPEALADASIAEWRRFREEYPDATGDWQVRRSIRVLFETPTVLTLGLENVGETGPEHTFEALRYRLLRPATGARLAIGDLLIDGGTGQLAALAEQAFRATRGVAPGTSLAAAGFTFPDDRFALPDDVGVLREGVAVHWDAAAIAPYASGATDLLLSWSAVQPLLREDSALPPR
ncbi:MAG: DUF3298 domain-containing protein [bacterium]|nr:DUF3298 domain-containing protein [bacterium]